MSSSVGIMKFPIYGKYKIFQTTNPIGECGVMVNPGLYTVGDSYQS